MFFILFPAIIILGDQLFKYWVTTKLVEGGTIPLIKGFIHLIYVENRGAAFGFLENLRWLLIVIAVIGILAIIYIMLTHKGSVRGKIALAAVLGGAIGNLVDRIVLGYVVDMFRFEFMDFAIFNIADIFITVGGIVFVVDCIISMLKHGEKDDKPTKRTWEPIQDTPVRKEPIIDFFAPTQEEDTVVRYEPVRAEKPIAAVIPTAPAASVASAVEKEKKYSASEILEEYDLERLLSEYRSEYDND